MWCLFDVYRVYPDFLEELRYTFSIRNKRHHVIFIIILTIQHILRNQYQDPWNFKKILDFPENLLALSSRFGLSFENTKKIHPVIMRINCKVSNLDQLLLTNFRQL